MLHLIRTIVAWISIICVLPCHCGANVIPEFDASTGLSAAATGLPIGLSVRQSVLAAGPVQGPVHGPALAPHGGTASAEGSRPAPIKYDLLPTSVNTAGGTQASLSISTGTFPTGGVTATASGSLGGTTTTAQLTFCDCILVTCMRCEDCLPPDKCAWPECVGMNVFEAQKLIEKESPRTPVLVMKGSATTTDWRGDRVRLFYDAATLTVVNVPEVG